MADNRYNGKEEQQQGSLIGSAARTGAVVGGGIFAFRNRAAISRGFSELTSSTSLLGSRALGQDNHISQRLADTRVLLTGISDSLGDSPSVLRTLRGGFDKNVQEKMRNDFEKSVRNSIESRKLAHLNKPGQNRTEFASRYYRDFHKRENGGLNKFQYAATKQFRENQIQKELRKKSTIEKNGGDKILGAITEFNKEQHNFLNNPADHINDFMKKLQSGDFNHSVKFADKTQKNAFQKQVMETLEKYKSTKKVFEANKDHLNANAQKFETAAAFGFIQDAIKSTSQLGKQLGKKGYRGLTLKDAEKLDVSLKRKHGLIIDDVDHKGNNVSVDVTTELRKFLKSHKNNNELKSHLKNNGINFDFEDMALDPYLFRHARSGEIIDDRHLRDGTIKALDAFQSTMKIPFLNINPLDLTPWQALRSGKAKEGLHVLSAGQIHGFVRNLDGQSFNQATKPTQTNAIRNPLSNSDHFYTGGNVWRLNEKQGLELVDQGLYLAPSQFGAFSRMHKNMTNHSQLDTVDDRGWLRKLFDVGHQEGESRLTTYKKAWNKLSDPNYGPNAIKSLAYDLHAVGDNQADRVKEAYGVLRVGIDRNTTSLTREAAEVLSPHVNKLFKDIEVNGKAFDFARLSDDEYVKDAAVVFNRELKNASSNVNIYKSHTRSVYDEGLSARDTSRLYDDPSVRELQRWTNKYIQDPEGFSFARSASVNRELPIDFIVNSLGDSENLIPATDQLRRSFHQYALRALDDEVGDFAKENIKNGIRKRSSLAYLIDAKNKGLLSESDVRNAKDLELLTDLLSYDNIHSSGGREREAKTFLEDIMSFKGDSISIDNRSMVFENGGIELSGFGQEIQSGILRAQPIFGRAPDKAPPSPNGADFIIMRKGGVANNAKENLSNINLNIMNYGPVDDGWDLAINTEFMLRDTTSKLVKTGHDVIGEIFAGRGRRGDSLDKVTTTTAITYGLAERLDNQLTNFGLGLSQQHLGSFQSIIGNQFARRIALPYMAYQQAVYFDGLTGDAVSDTLADAYVNTHSTIQDIKEITGINRVMRPWKKVFEQAAGTDQIGEWMGVKQLDFLTFGMFSDFRSGDDVRDFYESGEVAIRKNRYWGIGSPSPWAGGGISHYEPNWYRKAKSDYKFTDTMYGSEKEYWANHFMPTLTNPFAPIKHFITDPYHYEKKHEVDRPYAITGGFSEIQNIPLVGSLIDGTVGRVLKPRKEHQGLEKAHREYLASINEYIQDQYSPVKDGTYVGVSGTGAIQSFNIYGDSGTGDLFGGTAAVYGDDAGHVNYGNGVVGTYKTTASGGGGTSGTGSGTSSLGGSLTGAEKTKSVLAAENLQLAMAGKGIEVGPTSSLHKLRNMGLEADLSSMERVDSIKGQVLDAFYSASELGGIYGFATKTGIGYEESWRGTTLASSSLMTSPSRAFWDMNLGGAGGALSEIGRRYAPRDPNKNYYSPIRNTMPDWLPSIGDPIDFLHGDPYVKIQKGEMRLPGKAYETLYKLHPDGTGTGEFANYGILDRFRILADVAPDSEQYEVATHQIALLRQAGGITPEMDKEIKEIKRQVSSKQDTIRWYDKKFTNAEIQKETVTIEKVIDGNMFKVREYDAPIKLAGVKLTKKDNQDVIDWMSQYIKEGEKIKIGLTDDPATRVNNDTYGSMSAVVYTNKNEEGRFWFETNKGQSLNALIANRKWQNEVEIKDDGSAANTRALYSNDMVTVGKYMEFITHDVLPKVPFVGILADKFLQVRTPIESYIREQVYSTDWRPWQKPYEGWIKPMVNTVASQNPLIAGAEMAAIGHMFNKTPRAKGIGRVAGFAIGAGMSSLRVFNETAENFLPNADGIWLPKEREKEREINQYFDRLKYVKYRGLYEQARKLAKSEEGVDVEEFFDAAAEKGERNKGLKNFLTNQKRMLSFSKKMGYGDSEAVNTKIDSLNSGLEGLQSDREAYQAGQYTSLAIRYRNEYEGTLYGLGEYGAADRTALMRALTPKEREYIPRFLETTSSKERQQILKYVPEDIKRILQGSWGLKVDKQEDIEDYFDGHYLPGANWSGWNASTNLDDIKIKVMKKEGINPTLSGYWQQDQARAEQQGAKAIPMHSLSSRIDSNRLSEVLQGLGLSDVDVQLTTSYGEGPGGINTSMDIIKDVKKDILDTMNASIHSIF